VNKAGEFIEKEKVAKSRAPRAERGPKRRCQSFQYYIGTEPRVIIFFLPGLKKPDTVGS
jgi:hypothetical protein